MEYERKGVTITWQIENIKNIYESLQWYTPVISVDLMDGTKWKLVMNGITGSNVWMGIKREDDNGPTKFELDYEFSAKTPEGTFPTEKSIHTHPFTKDGRLESICSLKIGGISHSHFNSDTIIIRCKIWKHVGSILKTGQFFVRTRMKEEEYIFVGKIQKFGAFPLYERSSLQEISSSTGENLMEIKFYLMPHPKTRKTNLFLQIKRMDKQTDMFVNFKLFILDSSENKTNIGKFKKIFSLAFPHQLLLPDVSKEDLIKNSTLYLPNDTLSLRCEITYCFETDYEGVERTEYETDSIEEVKQTNFSKEMEFLISKVESLCDTEIQTATETFPAHTAILSAKSPAFEAMFQSDMKETIEGCVHIDDVDAETVKRMLVFLYSDTLEEMKWKDAMKLHIAADKYQIVSLKSRCTEFLKQKMDLSNCIVLLRLANKHSDKDLLALVQDYIKSNKECVSDCDQWTHLKKDHPHLTKILS